MGSVTKKIIIDDIILRVTEAHPTDDFNVPRSQIGYMIDGARDEVVANQVAKDIRRGNIPNPIYIEKEGGKSITSENDGSSIGCAIRHYVTVDKDPVWITGNDDGIVLVQFNNGTKVDRIKHNELDILKYLSGAKASLTSPVFHREGRNIYIDEITDIQANEIKVHVHYIPTVGHVTDETLIYSVDDSVREVITEYVVEKVIQELGGTIDDKIEDGDTDNE